MKAPHITQIPDATVGTGAETGIGALRSAHGNLPLRSLDVDCHVAGLSARTVVTQRFTNPHQEFIEAEYIFPLPHRAAVTRMTMTVGDRTVEAGLRERAAARRQYSDAIAEGKRAAIAEAERDDIFTMRVGNIPAGAEATVTIETVGPVPYADGEATVRIPLVVAPRFIPGEPQTNTTGDGYALDTDVVPDASRITPPVLLPGLPNPVELSLAVTIAPAGLEWDTLASSMHGTSVTELDDGAVRITLDPGQRLNRDFVLRFGLPPDSDITSTLVTTADTGTTGSGTFQLTVMPPPTVPPRRDKDVVLLLDRSGSMKGWKLVAARRAAARIVDTLTARDRFAVRCFDTRLTAPPGQESGLIEAEDSPRFHATEHLMSTQAGGGTDILTPLSTAVDLLSESGADRDRVTVLVTDGHVGNEDQIVALLSERVAGITVHAVGIDTAVNAGFLHRLALLGRGRVELVESEAQLDTACARVHRRIVAPLVTHNSVTLRGASLENNSLTPFNIPDLFVESPVVLWGRYRDAVGDEISAQFTGTDAAGAVWTREIIGHSGDFPQVSPSWARSRLRDLEDDYAASRDREERQALEKTIVDISLRDGVLSRFTAFVAVDSQVVNDDGTPRTIVQPVEMPQGWEMAPPRPGKAMAAGRATRGPAVRFGGAPPSGAAESGTRARRATSRGGRRGRVMPLGELRDALRAELRGMEAFDSREEASLTDLASRLRVLASQMREHDDVPAVAVETLAQLCEALEQSTGLDLAAVTALWNRSREALQESLTRLGGDPGASGEFWKR